mgnify:CR=1 FL=1
MSMAQELRTAKIDVNCYAGARSALRGIIPSARQEQIYRLLLTVVLVV